MSVSIYEDRIKVEDKRDALRILLMIKCHQKDIKLSPNDINTLIELYLTGYNDEFFENCIEKGYFDSKQTVLNAIGRMGNLGILWYKKKGERFINKEFLPDLSEEKVLIKYMFGNL